MGGMIESPWISQYRRGLGPRH